MSVEIKVHGEMSLTDIEQCLIEQLKMVEDRHAIRYSQGATLYINPTNGFGDKVTARYENGQEVKKINCRGPYKSAADEYEP